MAMKAVDGIVMLAKEADSESVQLDPFGNHPRWDLRSNFVGSS
jgi:hypothetical protein